MCHFQYAYYFIELKYNTFYTYGRTMLQCRVDSVRLHSRRCVDSDRVSEGGPAGRARSQGRRGGRRHDGDCRVHQSAETRPRALVTAMCRRQVAWQHRKLHSSSRSQW